MYDNVPYGLSFSYATLCPSPHPHLLHHSHSSLKNPGAF